jgi:hypothetical protein
LERNGRRQEARRKTGKMNEERDDQVRKKDEKME